MRIKYLLVSLTMSVCAMQSTIAQTPVYKVIYSPLSSTVPGANPNVVFEAKPGLFYVLSIASNSTFGSSILSVTNQGGGKPMYTLPPNLYSDVMVQGTNGRIYSPGHQSGGTIPNNFYYSILLSGSGYQQYQFSGSQGSADEILVAPLGEFYDIIGSTGRSSTYGFARLDETGKITVLHQFSGSEGLPIGTNIVYGPDGNIYGVGAQPSQDPGFIFRFTPTGTYSQIATIPQPKITYPQGYVPLIAGSDGNLYGALKFMGANNTGEIYQVTLAGQLQAVASFPAKGMSGPQTLVQGSDGNIYGNAGAYIFRYNLASHQLSPVYQLSANTSQGECPCKLIEGMDGKLYGVTPLGGPGIGVVFSLDIGIPKPLPVVSGLYPSSGAVGQRVLLWGNFLLGATSVTFNGAPATGVVSTSVQSVQAVVPSGATSGPVTITTGNGSFTTTQSFTVQ